MNIYKISSYYYDPKECDSILTDEYIIHEKQFTEEEFNKMCKKGTDLDEIKDCFDLKKYLIQNYGFISLKPIANYEFEEI